MEYFSEVFLSEQFDIQLYLQNAKLIIYTSQNDPWYICSSSKSLKWAEP